MALDDRLPDGRGEPRALVQGRRGAGVGGLAERLGDQLLADAVDHARAEACRRPVARVEVELAKPRGAREASGARRGLPRLVDEPRAVARRRDRVVVDVDAPAQGLRPARIGQRRACAAGDRQCALERDGHVGPAGQRRDRQRPRSRAGGQPRRPQLAGQRPEVAAVAGREPPVVVQRQLDDNLVRGPGRRERRIGAVDRQAEAGLAPGAERRHEAGVVVPARRQPSRRQQPRERRRRAALQRGVDRRGLVEHLGVRPGPRVGQVGQLLRRDGRSADPQARRSDTTTPGRYLGPRRARATAAAGPPRSPRRA